jgi:putative endonuclease
MKRVGCWFVYFLRCGDGTLYAGITTDLQRRLSAHRAGKGAAYTRSRPPLKLVYRETAAGRSEALRREAALRRLSRREKLSLIRSASGGVERKRKARSRAWVLLLLGASSLTSRAVAEEPQFTRLIQTSRITGGSLSAAYAGEIQGALGAAPAPGGSSGWAAPGLTHWFYAYCGAAPWLTLALGLRQQSGTYFESSAMVQLGFVL